MRWLDNFLKKWPQRGTKNSCSALCAWQTQIAFIIRHSLLLFLVFPADAAFVEVNSGQRIDGVQISASANGAVTLVTATGQKMTFRKGQYRRAVADKPREFLQIEKLLKSDDPSKAEALLKKIKSNYRFLSWDQNAIDQLANLYFEQGRFAEAVAEFQALEAPNATAQSRLCEAMVKSGDPAQVLSLLEEEIASGSREAAARAYLLRGDLRAANGNTAGARRDWLKVATFFKSQKEAAKQAEGKLVK